MIAVAQHDVDVRVLATRRRIAVAEDREIRRLLGLWASGLDPALAYDRHGRFVGLTIAGLPLGTAAPIVLRAWTSGL